MQNDTIVDYIIHNLKELKDNYDKYKDDPDAMWWEGEYGNDLVDCIDCHPVFKDGLPCLNDERGVDYQRKGWEENCRECKAKWLMQKFE